MSNSPSSDLNFIKFREARLQAVSSRNIYSLHGLEALMGALLGQGCQLLISVWTVTPGPPKIQAASDISFNRSFARYVSIVSRWSTDLVVHALSSSVACMKSSVTRMEGFAFW